MTNKEAIIILQCVEAYGLADEAKKKAIEALREQEKFRWHDLREDPSDLPEHDYDYILIENGIYSRAWYQVVSYVDGFNNMRLSDGTISKACEIKDVRRWKYIEP